MIDYRQAAELRVLPLAVVPLPHAKVLKLAAAAPADAELAKKLKFITGMEIRLVPSESIDLQRQIFAAYHGDESALARKLSSLALRRKTSTDQPNRDTIRETGGDATAFLCSLIDYAIARGGSDLHIMPRHDGGFVQLRINGELLSHESPVIDLALQREVVNRLKVLAKLDLTQKSRPQDGSFEIEAGGGTVGIRLSLMPTVHGEKAVLRILGAQSLLRLAELGLAPDVSQLLNDLMRRAEGALIFAGATGSGKSSSMYAIVSELAERSLSVASLEDPVELAIPKISQSAINLKAGLDYATGLRSILRQDPDVVLVGEIRDSETAKIALQAALTGHLLLSTVHARDAFEVLLRLAGLGVDCLTLSQALNLVIRQLLLPALCESCKVADLRASAACGREAWQPVGCQACDYSGYAGRELVCEALAIDGELARAIAEGKLARRTLRPLAERYVGIESSLEALLSRGKISLNQFMEALPPKSEREI